MPEGTSIPLRSRRQLEARRVAESAYPFKCCVVCGLGSVLQVAHLDHQAGNDDRDNLAWLCPTHHGMFDAGLYPIEGIKQLRAHWQLTEGKLNHKARMRDAGVKAALTRKRSASARKAWATRRATGLPASLD